MLLLITQTHVKLIKTNIIVYLYGVVMVVIDFQKVFKITLPDNFVTKINDVCVCFITTIILLLRKNNIPT